MSTPNTTLYRLMATTYGQDRLTTLLSGDTSLREIARIIEEATGIKVSHETIRTWKNIITR